MPHGHYVAGVMAGDLMDGQIFPADDVNETVPLGYWRSKSTETRIEQARKAVQKAGLAWPAGRAASHPASTSAPS